MTKFSGNKKRPVRTAVAGPIKTTETRVPTYEGGDGFSRDPESELFLLAVTNMVGEATFYESALMRDTRFRTLIRHVAKTNPDFIRGSDPAAGKIGLAEYLRQTMNMRSASVVMAAEFVASGAPGGRQVVARALQRADEPAEILGYWLSEYGRKIPQGIKRGVADAVRRLYNEFSALKYDGESRGIRMGDVIELVHPSPKDARQSALFRFLIDTRHNRAKTISEYEADLKVLAGAEKLASIPEGERRQYLRDNPTALADAAWTWERLSGWLPGGMDGEAWSFVVGPEAKGMGYMALLRNLRNFDTKGLPEALKDAVSARIADPAEVEKSRQFPYRFWSAYKFAPSEEWGKALSRALDHSVRNIPVLKGNTLVLIDTSGSMQAPVSEKSKVARFEVGALFAGALAKAGESVDVVQYGMHSGREDMKPGESVLRFIERTGQQLGKYGHATYTFEAVARHYAGHDRVVIFTDEQAHDSYGSRTAGIPVIHTFNLGGYRTAGTPNGTKGRYAYGGFTDATFTLMALLESGKNADWPF